MTIPRIVLLGCGGHARETLGILLDCQANGLDVTLAGFIDEDPRNHGRTIHGYPVLGDFTWFEHDSIGGVEVICAVGSPEVARRMVKRAQERELTFAKAVSPRAIVAGTARVGAGVIVFPNVVVSTEAVVGDHVTLNVAVTVSHDTVLGDFCNVNPGAHLAGNVTLGEGCYVGMGANVIQDVTVGPWTLIGAGAVDLDDLPRGVTAVGVPARVVRQRPPEHR